MKSAELKKQFVQSGANPAWLHQVNSLVSLEVLEEPGDVEKFEEVMATEPTWSVTSGIKSVKRYQKN